MEEMLQFLNLLHPMSAELQITLMQVFQREVHRPNKNILSEGEVCDWVAFVEKGLLKAYIELDDGTERVIWYRKAGEVISSVGSFHHRSPTQFAIRTIEETHLRKISRSVLENLYDRFPGLNVHARLLLQGCCSESEQRTIDGCFSLKERYRKLHEQESWLLFDPRIRDYMLAAYLNVDKATFSRFKGKKY
jgi:CRP-like cAMP-binding protein